MNSRQRRKIRAEKHNKAYEDKKAAEHCAPYFDERDNEPASPTSRRTASLWAALIATSAIMGAHDND